MLFEACLSGKLHHVPRRPHDRERSNLIKSGSVFIYEENASGIKRWTDGVAWSPSRILGNFLIYRELEKPFPPGEKKRAMKRKRSQELDGRRDSEDNDASEYAALPPTPPSPVVPVSDQKPDVSGGLSEDKEMERQLIGSLVDSYGFRPNGLVKKTMSISLNGVSHHMVSYYTVEDVKQRRLHRPLTDSRLSGLTVRPELFMKQNFRAPVEETEHYAVDAIGHAYPHMVYSPMIAGHYGMQSRSGSYGGPGYPVYGMASTGGMYSSVPATAWPPTQSTATAGYPAQPYSGPQYDYYNRNPSVSGTPQASGSVKQEDPNTHNPSYMSYMNSYSSAARPGNPPSAYPPMQSQPQPYQSPSRATENSYGSHSTPATSGQPPSSHAPNSTQQSYSSNQAPSHSAQQQYQNYPVPPQASSPHGSMKSPVAGSTHSLSSLPPRSSLSSSMGGYQGSYPSQGGPPGNANTGSSYGNHAPSSGPGAYGGASYNSSSHGNGQQNYRSTTEGGAGVAANGYS